MGGAADFAPFCRSADSYLAPGRLGPLGWHLSHSGSPALLAGVALEIALLPTDPSQRAPALCPALCWALIGHLLKCTFSTAA